MRDLRRKANPNHTGQESYNWFSTVIFPHNQMQILDYNRVVKDLNGLSPSQVCMVAARARSPWGRSLCRSRGSSDDPAGAGQAGELGGQQADRAGPDDGHQVAQPLTAGGDGVGGHAGRCGQGGIGGIQTVNGIPVSQSVYGRDPVHPAGTSHIADLSPGKAKECYLIPVK